MADMGAAEGHRAQKASRASAPGPRSLRKAPPAIGQVELLPKEGVFDATSHAGSLIEALNTNRNWVMEATQLCQPCA